METYEAMSDHPVFSDGMIEIVDSFVVEARKILEEINKEIPQLGQAKVPLPLIDKIFRGVHTVKGLSTFLGLEQLSLISHRFEGVLNRFRKGEQVFHPEMMNVMVSAVDAMNQLVQQIPDGSISPLPMDGLLDDLQLLAQDGFSEAVVLKSANSWHKPKSSVSLAPSTGSSVRVDVAKLDGMLGLLDSINRTRGQIEEIVGGLDPLSTDQGKIRELSNAASVLGDLTCRLQSALVHARMIRAVDVFTRFRGITRELASNLGKEVELILEGADVEIDRSIVDDLTDPLLQMARNAVDHGIEPPHLRMLRDKPICGQILLKVASEDRDVVITIEDDGDGIDVQKLCRRAVERGFVADREAAKMEPSDVMNLIFKPGFTTHDEATRISGRGVGMDVVKTNVQRLGGTVHVESEPGRFTRFTLRLPLYKPTNNPYVVDAIRPT